MRHLFKIAALGLVATTPVFCGFVPVSGVDFLSTPPADVLALSSDTSMFAWQEQSQLTLSSNVTVGLTHAGLYGCTASIPCPAPSDSSIIPAGTVVNSYYVHYAPQSLPPSQSFRYLQSVMTFDDRERVIGVITGAQNLRSTDSVFQPAGSTYPTNNTISGVELGTDRGKVQITTDGVLPTDKIGFFGAANITGDTLDDMRIVTAMIPEPTSIFLLGSGLAGLAFWRNRNRRSV